MTTAQVTQLQLAINRRCRAHHLPLITVDGEIGPQTTTTGRRVAWLLGYKLGRHHDRISVRAAAIIQSPSKRGPAELARALARRRLRPLRLRAWDQMQHLIDLRVSEVGSNNHGPWVEKIIRTNGGVPGEPWCGDTVAACYLWAGSKTVLRGWASVDWLVRNLTVVDPSRVKRGHIVTYTFSHTGLFDQWTGPGEFLAGEGNTGNTGAVSDSVTGADGVKLKHRSTSLVSGYRRVLG